MAISGATQALRRSSGRTGFATHIFPGEPRPLPIVRGFRNGNIDLNGDENLPCRRERRLIASRADLRETMDQRTG